MSFDSNICFVRVSPDAVELADAHLAREQCLDEKTALFVLADGCGLVIQADGQAQAAYVLQDATGTKLHRCVSTCAVLPDGLSLVFSHEGSCKLLFSMLTVSADGTADRCPVFAFGSMPGVVTASKQVGTGSLLISANAEGMLMLWDTADGAELDQVPAAHHAAITALECLGDETVLSGCGCGWVCLWSVVQRRLTPVHKILAGDAAITALAGFLPAPLSSSHAQPDATTAGPFHPSTVASGPWLAVGAEDGHLSVWKQANEDSTRWDCTHSADLHEGPVIGIAVSRDGEFVAASCSGAIEGAGVVVLKRAHAPAARPKRLAVSGRPLLTRFAAAEPPAPAGAVSLTCCTSYHAVERLAWEPGPPDGDAAPATVAADLHSLASAHGWEALRVARNELEAALDSDLGLEDALAGDVDTPEQDDGSAVDVGAQADPSHVGPVIADEGAADPGSPVSQGWVSVRSDAAASRAISGPGEPSSRQGGSADEAHGSSSPTRAKAGKAATPASELRCSSMFVQLSPDVEAPTSNPKLLDSAAIKAEAPDTHAELPASASKELQGTAAVPPNATELTEQSCTAAETTPDGALGGSAAARDVVEVDELSDADEECQGAQSGGDPAAADLMRGGRATARPEARQDTSSPECPAAIAPHAGGLAWEVPAQADGPGHAGDEALVQRRLSLTARLRRLSRRKPTVKQILGKEPRYTPRFLLDTDLLQDQHAIDPAAVSGPAATPAGPSNAPYRSPKRRRDGPSSNIPVPQYARTANPPEAKPRPMRPLTERMQALSQPKAHPALREEQLERKGAASTASPGRVSKWVESLAAAAERNARGNSTARAGRATARQPPVRTSAQSYSPADVGDEHDRQLATCALRKMHLAEQEADADSEQAAHPAKAPHSECDVGSSRGSSPAANDRSSGSPRRPVFSAARSAARSPTPSPDACPARPHRHVAAAPEVAHSPERDAEVGCYLARPREGGSAILRKRIQALQSSRPATHAARDPKLLRETSKIASAVTHVKRSAVMYADLPPLPDADVPFTEAPRAAPRGPRQPSAPRVDLLQQRMEDLWDPADRLLETADTPMPVAGIRLRVEDIAADMLGLLA